MVRLIAILTFPLLGSSPSRRPELCAVAVRLGVDPASCRCRSSRWAAPRAGHRRGFGVALMASGALGGAALASASCHFGRVTPWPVRSPRLGHRLVSAPPRSHTGSCSGLHAHVPWGTCESWCATCGRRRGRRRRLAVLVAAPCRPASGCRLPARRPSVHLVAVALDALGAYALTLRLTFPRLPATIVRGSCGAAPVGRLAAAPAPSHRGLSP